MIKEKSCGAVIYRIQNQKLQVLVIHQVQGHWCFPKGHVETGETEEQTAAREIKEETGLEVSFTEGFRETTAYSPKEGVMKKVVYFLATPAGGNEEVQESEVSEMQWVRPVQAMAALTYADDARLLRRSMRYLRDMTPDLEDYL